MSLGGKVVLTLCSSLEINECEHHVVTHCDSPSIDHGTYYCYWFCLPPILELQRNLVSEGNKFELA